MYAYISLLLLISMLGAGCAQENKTAKPAADASQLLVSMLQTSLAATDLGKMVSEHAKGAAVRQLAIDMQREQGELRAAAAAIAGTKNIPVTDDIEPRKVALKDNMAQLYQPQYDIGYVLATVQDLNAEVNTMQLVVSLGDSGMKQLAERFLPVLRARQRAANALLNQMGGSPFGMPP